MMNCRYFVSVLLLFVFSLVSYSQDLQVETEVIALPQHIGDKCNGTFFTHNLDHTTTTPHGYTVKQFEANGSGVAINDLDNDGDLDIVLANHAGMNAILWNEGDLNFRTEHLTHGDSRAVSIVDIDGDGWNDIFFTRTASAPTYWHNLGEGTFEQEFLPNIAEPLYSVAWADLDEDGDLDFVGGTYDAALLNAYGQEFLLNNNAGIYYYQNVDGVFKPKPIAYNAQALAIILVDINHDDRLDIVVGNDFAVPDYIWIRSDDGWEASNMFTSYSHSTMSYDFADLDNDGYSEIFSTDMKPYADDSATMSAWQPIMKSMSSDRSNPNEPQVMENVLLKQSSYNIFKNEAKNRGIDSSGWSWSGKFADLDQDGYLDLYIVNGFIEFTMFAHLDNHELVEENQAFRNIEGNLFERMPEWKLSSTSSGRGMSMADLDMDGDLDIVVNNLRSPAQLFENQLCSGSSLQIDLVWAEVHNQHQIGAELLLHTNNGTFRRDIKSSSGYLSGDTTRIHFGFPLNTLLESLEIMWTDGKYSTIEVPPQTQYMILRRMPMSLEHSYVWSP